MTDTSTLPSHADLERAEGHASFSDAVIRDIQDLLGMAPARGFATAHRSNDGCSCGLVRFWTLEHVAEELVRAGLTQSTPGATR